MSDIRLSHQYISVQKYAEELQAQIAAQKKQISVLYKEVDRLTGQKLMTNVTGGILPSICEKCPSKDKKIIDLQTSIKELNNTRNKQKIQYERKLNEEKQRQLQKEKQIRVNSQHLEKQDDLKNLQRSQEVLKQKLDQLKTQKNSRIQQLQKTCSYYKSESMKTQAHHQSQIQSLNQQIFQLKNQKDGQSASNLSHEFMQLQQNYEQLHRKYNQLVMQKSKQWTQFPTESYHQHFNVHNIDSLRIQKQNLQLLEKVQFLEKRVFKLEDWNQTLRNQILMKMHTNINTLPANPHYYPPSHTVGIPLSYMMPEKQNQQDQNINQKEIPLSYEKKESIQSLTNILNNQKSAQMTYEPQMNFPNMEEQLQSNKNKRIFKYYETSKPQRQQADRFVPISQQGANRLVQHQNMVPNQQVISVKKEKKPEEGVVSKFFQTLFRSEKPENQ